MAGCLVVASAFADVGGDEVDTGEVALSLTAAARVQQFAETTTEVPAETVAAPTTALSAEARSYDEGRWRRPATTSTTAAPTTLPPSTEPATTAAPAPTQPP
ncbi:MAG: hypothetical protein ACK5PP_14080, partial [Acidimicrobiales bacterium]